MIEVESVANITRESKEKIRKYLRFSLASWQRDHTETFHREKTKSSFIHLQLLLKEPYIPLYRKVHNPHLITAVEINQRCGSNNVSKSNSN